MLNKIEFLEKPEKDELKKKLKKAKEELVLRQNRIKEKQIPVFVVVEGWGTAGKGTLIGDVIDPLDPRFFKVATFKERTPEEKRFPFLKRYFDRIPENGQFMFYDTGWMKEIAGKRINGEMNDRNYNAAVNSVRRFERTLCDNGYVLLKFFCQISKKEQAKRIEKLESDKNTAWRIGEKDHWQNEHYEECARVFERYLEDTDVPYAPWYIVDASSEKWAHLQILEKMIEAIDIALENDRKNVPILQNSFELVSMPKLKDIPLKECTLSEKEYDKKLDKLQNKIAKLQNELYRKKIPVIVAYEGWDAAGKGGNIKRLTASLDPRGFEVNPIASPEPHEKARHFLWRFWTRLPKDGHIAVFDRTWYGRVMVERIEGFCSENDWKRAYNEINEFEDELCRGEKGAVLVKFWVQIDKDTQLERFNDRQNTPEKQWKITEEDWRNREKWDVYEEAIDEMIAKTSTSFAPWYVLESVDKKYARIKALEIVIREMEKALER